MKKKEIWKDIPEWEGFYQASNLGNIRSVDRIVINKGGKSQKGDTKNKIKGKILKQTKSLYYYVNLCRDGVHHVSTVHRLVASAFHLNPENKGTVNHKDGDKFNNHESNLELATQSENSLHAIRTGLRTTFAKPTFQRKLTEKQVLDISRKYSTGNYTQKQLGDKYGVHFTTIGKITTKTNWPHLWTN